MTPRRRDNLKRLLAPRHVAFIGGSSAELAARQCAGAGFDGAIWGVNPGRKEIGGNPCFARVEDLPHPPDAVFVAVPREAVVETVAALARVGAGGAVCYTAGFGELGGDGEALERDLVAAAGDLALVGPNCLGLLNYVNNVVLWPYGHGGKAVKRGVAVISQSGLLCTNLTMSRRSVPFAHLISIGNQAVLSIEDFIDVLVDDPAVSAIGFYAEGLNDVPGFADAAIRALKKGVPIVALKAGSSELGARLTITHTGSLSGTDALFDALFRRLGVIRVTSPVALLETLKMLSIPGILHGRRIAAFTCSGGDATMLADGGAREGLEFPQPSEAVAAALRERLPAIATVANPLDYTTPIWGFEDELTDIFQAMFRDDYDAALIVQDYMSPEFETDNAYYLADTRAFIRATQAAGIPGAVCSSIPENLPAHAREIMIEGRVAPLQGIDAALAALGHAASYGEMRARVIASGHADRLRVHPLPAATGSSRVLDEWQGKQRLAAAGIPVPEGALADVTTAAEVSNEIGFPVAVKLVSAELAHKSEAGAVRTGLTNGAEVEDAIRAIIESVGRHAPGIAAERFLVERMVENPVAELLVGIRRDPSFGQVMVLASGGVLVELVGDAVTLLLPVDRDDVSRAIQSLRVCRLLDGYRGAVPADTGALIDAVARLAGFAEEHRASLVELDVNPLMALANGVCAVDVLLRTAD